MIYFDNNATTITHPEILKHLSEWVTIYANPSALHSEGRKAREFLEKARHSILEKLNLEAYKLVFTSTGSESNIIAHQFLFEEGPEDRCDVLISSIEHPCIYNLKNSLTNAGYNVKLIPVTKDGIVDLNFIEEHCTEDTAMVSIMHANNETGIIQPLKKIREITDEFGIYFHSDSIQSLGKTKNEYKEIDADSFVFSAHKIYGLKGISCLVYRTKPAPIFVGGGQEKGIRPGTENLLGVLAFEKAVSLISENEENNLLHLKKLQDYLEKELIKLGGEIIGKDSPRLFNTTSVKLPIENEKLLIELDKQGIGVSRGSACNAGSWEPSRSILSLGLSKESANKVIRISTGIFNTFKELEILIQSINSIIKTV